MAPDRTSHSLAGRDRQRSLSDARWWFGLAILSLLLAGGLSIAPVIGRVPLLAAMVDSGFATRSLVVHVNLALGVWFFAFLAGMFCLLPGAASLRLSKPAALLGVAGTLMFFCAFFLRDAVPVKSNYVPALDHWLFLCGLGLFAASVAISFIDARLVSPRGDTLLPPGSVPALRLGAVVYLLAMGTFFTAWATQPAGLEPLPYFERLFWGGGHVLQFANVLGMCAAWLLLLCRAAGRPVLKSGLLLPALGLLALPTLAGPWLATREDGWGWFTLMMQLGIFPVVLGLGLCAGVALWRGRGQLAPGALRTPGFVGFATSAGMTVIGFALGGLISAQDTLIPAHYHVNIGAVTAAYMATILTLLPDFGMQPRGARMRKLAAWQPLVYGVSQVIFAGGFGYAQAERKVYGAQQVLRTTGQWIGMSVMGLGGLFALVAGILFLAVLVSGWRGRAQSSPQPASQ